MIWLNTPSFGISFPVYHRMTFNAPVKEIMWGRLLSNGWRNLAGVSFSEAQRNTGLALSWEHRHPSNVAWDRLQTRLYTYCYILATEEILCVLPLSLKSGWKIGNAVTKKMPLQEVKVKKKQQNLVIESTLENPPKVNKPSRILRFKVVKLLCPEITLSLFVNTVTAHPSTKPKKRGKFRA